MARKTALITGANRGIGFEIAKQLGQKGFHILLSGRDHKRVEEAVYELSRLSVSVQPLVMDVSDVAGIQAAFQSISAQIHHIDVLVNNAGILLDEHTPLLSALPEDVQQTFSVNAFGAFFTVQTFLPLLGENSRVINVSSGAGQLLQGPTTWAPVYSMSKTLLNAITMQLAEALKPRHIAVNAICPGWVRTDMGGAAASRSVAKGAETVTWLATEADQHITGKFFRDKKEIHW